VNTAFIRDCADVEIAVRQRATISGYARNHGIKIDAWVNASDFSADALSAGDMLLIEKTFRLAKDVRSIALLLENLLNRGVIICSCEDGLRLGDDCLSSGTVARLFGIVAKIAEDMHSRLTKEGLENAKEAGRVLGRPRGRLNGRTKLTGRDEEIADLLAKGCSRAKIARDLRVDPRTLNGFIQKRPELKGYVSCR